MASPGLELAPLVHRWQRLGKRQRLAVSAAACLLVVAGIDGIALRPLRRQLARLHHDVQDAEQRLLTAMAANAQAKDVTQAFAAYESYVSPSGSAEAELPAVLGEVEAAVRQSGMTQLGLRPDTGRRGGDSAVSVALEAEAAPTQLIRFLDSVQRSTRLLKVVELTARVSDNKTLRASLIISKLLVK